MTPLLALLKAKPLLAWIIAGGVAAGGAAGTYVYVNNEPEEPAEIAALVPQTPADAPAATEQAEPAPEAVAELPVPRFDLLRVEPDGSAVIAGSAPADSAVELLKGATVLATTNAGGEGDFAIVLDNPLSPGTHELSLRATVADGRVVLSTETGIINIPENGEELLAVVAKEGEATRVLQASESEPAPEPEPQQVAKAEPAPEPETVLAPPTAPVLISAIDVEGGRIFVAGSGEPGRKVNLYLDGELLGNGDIGAQGGFLIDTARDLASGNYEMRADMLSADGSFVARRAAVRLVHEAPAPVVAKVEPEPVVTESEPEPEEQAAVEVPEIKSGASVIIRRGDNLWRISRRMLGRGVRYTTIYEANRDQIKNPNLIFPGQVLEVPGGSEPSEQDQSSDQG